MKQAKTTHSFRILPYKAKMVVMRLLGICMLVIIVISLLPLAVPYVKNALSFQYIRTAISIEKSFSSFVQGIIPTKFAGRDLTRWIIIVAAFILFRSFDSLRERYRSKIVNFKVIQDYEDLKTQKNLADDADVLPP